MTIVLHNIRSAWNVGSIMRTCDALGADLILVGYTPRPEGATLRLVAKTAIGAEHTVSWQHFDHYQQVLEAYPDKLHVAVEISKTSQNMFAYLKTGGLESERTFLWFGAEVHGLEPELVKKMSVELHLPMSGHKESLNVATTVTAVGYLLKFCQS